MFRGDYLCYLQRLNAMPTRVIDALGLINFRLACYREPILTEDRISDTSTFDKACMMNELKHSTGTIPLDDVLDGMANKCNVLNLTTTEVNAPPDNWEKVIPSRDLEAFGNVGRHRLTDLLSDKFDWCYYVLFIILVIGFVYVNL